METNFRVYAYSSSKLLCEILRLFSRYNGNVLHKQFGMGYMKRRRKKQKEKNFVVENDSPYVQGKKDSMIFVKIGSFPVNCWLKAGESLQTLDKKFLVGFSLQNGRSLKFKSSLLYNIFQLEILFSIPLLFYIIGYIKFPYDSSSWHWDGMFMGQCYSCTCIHHQRLILVLKWQGRISTSKSYCCCHHKRKPV